MYDTRKPGIMHSLNCKTIKTNKELRYLVHTSCDCDIIMSLLVLSTCIIEKVKHKFSEISATKYYQIFAWLHFTKRHQVIFRSIKLLFRKIKSCFQRADCVAPRWYFLGINKKNFIQLYERRGKDKRMLGERKASRRNECYVGEANSNKNIVTRKIPREFMRSRIDRIVDRRLLPCNQKMQLRSLSRVILVVLHAYDGAGAS